MMAVCIILKQNWETFTASPGFVLIWLAVADTEEIPSHETVHFGGHRPGELTHSSKWDPYQRAARVSSLPRAQRHVEVSRLSRGLLSPTLLAGSSVVVSAWNAGALAWRAPLFEQGGRERNRAFSSPIDT
jgi:hypothetical protein